MLGVSVRAPVGRGVSRLWTKMASMVFGVSFFFFSLGRSENETAHPRSSDCMDTSLDRQFGRSCRGGCFLGDLPRASGLLAEAFILADGC